jgi:hypothetical protein
MRKARLVLSVLFLLAAMWTPQLGAVCDKKCYDAPEGLECRDARRLGGSNCRIESSCTVSAVDPDGTGPQPPVIFVTCDYSCKIDYCMWV